MPPRPTTVWTAEEETALVNFLLQHSADAGDGGNFKKATFQRASAELAPLCVSGAAKNVKSYQNKWTSFRKIYRVICAIQEVSGWHWDDQTGASITPDSSSSWDDYVNKHPAAKPFRNKGWPHLHKVAQIIPSKALGANVFHPTFIQPTPDSGTPAPSITSDSLRTSPDPPSSWNSTTSDRKSVTPEPDILPPTASRKHSRDPVTPDRPFTKRARATTGAEALLNMSNSLTGLSTALTAALAPLPSTSLAPTPVRKTKAITYAIQAEKHWLDKVKLGVFIDILRGDPTAADVYMAIEDIDIREEWVRQQLEKLGVIAV